MVLTFPKLNILFSSACFYAIVQILSVHNIHIFLRGSHGFIYKAKPFVAFVHLRFALSDNNIQLYNVYVLRRKSLEVTNETAVSDRLEYIEWTQTEHVPHIGLTSMKVVSIADRAKQTIETTVAPFYGMVIGWCRLLA